MEKFGLVFANMPRAQAVWGKVESSRKIFFFFQAEDGIRDGHVTGVQTCALPISQAVCCVVFILLGQAGSTVHGAYQVLVTMTIITNFVPYLFMFAAMVRLQREPVEASVIRVPGGKPVAMGLACVGFVTTCAVILGSMIPDPSEPNKVVAVGKILALSALLLGGGVLLYWLGKKRAGM